MTSPRDHDLAIPPALATALREAAVAVPPAHHDLAGVRRRAQRHRRRRVTTTGAAAAAALLVGGLGVHRLVADGDADTDVVVPASVSGWQRTSQDAPLWVSRSVPEGWTLADLNSDPYQDSPSGPSTSQLFAVGGRSPLGRGVVLTSRAAEEGETTDGTETVRGQPGTIDPSETGDTSETLFAYWIEDGVFHEATAIGMSEAELADFLESLVPKRDPATGFTAPAGSAGSAGSALPELDAVTVEQQSGSFVSYRGPRNEVISVMVENTGAAGLLARLEGEPRGDGLVVTDLDAEDHPYVRLTRADGWSVTATVESGSPDPALLEAFVGDVEETTVGQLVDSGALGPATTVAVVDGMTVEVHGTDALDLAICLTPTTPATPAAGRSRCSGVADMPEFDHTSASFVVDGEWVIVTVTDGDEPGEVIDMTGTGPDEWAGDPLDGERVDVDGRIVEVVTVPPGADNVVAQSPMTEAGSAGMGYLRPE